ncbi:MAG: AAA family ATPase [Treponema sp.]|jgi:predicted ATPase|nr:AAA family ATPase [Treponema sp.]
MNKISRIKITGFRRLDKIDLAVKPFMTLIGINGVGKTSFLDALTLLSASASGDLQETLSQFGGIASLQTRDKNYGFSFLVNMNVPGYDPIEYSLNVTPQGTAYSISRETLSQHRSGYEKPFMHIDSTNTNICYFETGRGPIHPTWEHNHQETSLSQVPKMFQQPEELRRILATTTQYHTLDIGLNAPVKLPQQMKPAVLPGANGGDLVSYLYYLRESDHNRFEAITDSLRAAFPDFEELNFPPVAAGMLTMTWKDRNFNKPLYMHELSEGTLRFLWLVSLLQSPNLSTITMIDEPEVSMHPEQLSLLADLMRETSGRTQLIIATHSERLIRFLRPEEVVVMDVDETGCAVAAWADTLDLEKWLGEYSMDEVWRMGQLKGQ